MSGPSGRRGGEARTGTGLGERLLSMIARAGRLRRALPGPLRRVGLRLLPWTAMQRQLLPVGDDGAAAAAGSGRGVTLGIVREFSGSHRHYVAACRDLGVACRVVDLSGPDWVDVVRDSGCDAFLVRPEYLARAWKERQDDRVRIMADELGLVVYPTPKELWLYESKERVAHWLAANNVGRPRTWVFSSEERALEFARTAGLPVVWKTCFGSGASGVRILRGRRELLRAVRRSFRRGVRLPGAHPLDRQWGSAVFQEYLPDVREWRAIRMGRSYFALEKLKRGDFHSGSGRWSMDDPPLAVIDFARTFTESAGFTSMSIDIFETRDGEYLVNEMHTFFASPSPHKTKVGGHPGRYVYDENGGGWRFEEGTFFQNAGCNLRVETVLEMLERRKT